MWFVLVRLFLIDITVEFISAEPLYTMPYIVLFVLSVQHIMHNDTSISLKYLFPPILLNIYFKNKINENGCTLI